MLNGVGVGRCKFTCNLPKTRINAQRSAVRSRVRTHFTCIFREGVKRFCSNVTNHHGRPERTNDGGLQIGTYLKKSVVCEILSK